MPQDPDKYEDQAYEYDVAITLVDEDAYSSRKKIDKILLRLAKDTGRATNPQYFYQTIIEWEQTRDVEHALPILLLLDDTNEALLDSVVIDRDRTISASQEKDVWEAFSLAASAGFLHHYFRPQPDVEQWIEHVSQHIIDTFKKSDSFSAQSGKYLFSVLLGMSFVAHNLIAIVAELYKSEEKKREYNIIGTCQTELVSGIMIIILQKLRAIMPEGAGQQEEFAQSLEQFRKHRLRPYRMPHDSKLDTVQEIIEHLKTARDEIFGWFDTEKDRETLPLLATQLRSSPWYNEANEEEEWKRTPLPWGQVTLIEFEGEDHQHVLGYSVNGVAHMSALIVPTEGAECTTDRSLVPILPKTEEYFTCHHLLFATINDAGKVHTSTDDQFAPPAFEHGSDVSKSILAVERVMSERMLQLWEEEAALFARLEASGPFIYLKTPKQTFGLFPKEDISTTAQYIDGEPIDIDQIQDLLSRAHITFDQEFVAYLISQTPEQPDDTTAPAPTSRKQWRRRIRETIGRDRIPSVEWIEHHLKAFGVEKTLRGKGSHESLVLQRGSGDRRQGTWHDLRGTESLDYRLLWEFLDRLDITYQEFHESITSK